MQKSGQESTYPLDLFQYALAGQAFFLLSRKKNQKRDDAKLFCELVCVLSDEKFFIGRNNKKLESTVFS